MKTNKFQSNKPFITYGSYWNAPPIVYALFLNPLLVNWIWMFHRNILQTLHVLPSKVKLYNDNKDEEILCKTKGTKTHMNTNETKQKFQFHECHQLQFLISSFRSVFKVEGIPLFIECMLHFLQRSLYFFSSFFSFRIGGLMPTKPNSVHPKHN